jgi:hypothetical protein
VPLSELDLTAADLRRHGSQRPGPSVRERGGIVPIGYGGGRDDGAKDLVDRAIRAKGGLDKLRSIRTVRITSTTTVLGSSAGRVDVPTTIYIRYPGAFRVDAELPVGTVVQAFNAGRYWIHDPGGVRDVSSRDAEEIRGNVQRDTVALFLALADGKVPAGVAEPLEDGGRRLPGVAVESPTMRRVTLFFDPDTALLLRQRYTHPAAGRAMEERYSDYRLVDGLQVAFKAEVRLDGKPIAERTLRTFEYNVPLESSLFTKPS